MSCGIGCRCGLGLAFLWLWPSATALIQPLAWKPPYEVGVALKRQGKKKKKPCMYIILLPSLPNSQRYVASTLHFQRFPKLEESECFMHCKHSLRWMSFSLSLSFFLYMYVIHFDTHGDITIWFQKKWNYIKSLYNLHFTNNMLWTSFHINKYR